MESHSPQESEILFAGLIVFQTHLEFSRDATALSATHALVDSLCPLIGSSHSDHPLLQMIDILVAISGIQCEIGEFPAALEASHKALRHLLY